MSAAPSASSNSDTQELNKFAALAHRWWDEQGEFKPLHQMNPLRLAWIEELLGGDGALAHKNVLDVGCGGGILSESMARKNAHVTAIDLSEKPLQVAKLHALNSGVKVDYRLIAAEDLAAQSPAEFDLITCMEMLEHVPHPQQTVTAISRMLKPNGLAIFSTINRTLKSFVFAIVGAEYVLRLLPRGTHQYQRFITPAELVLAAQSSSLTPLHIKGMQYNPFSKLLKQDGQAFHLNEDVSINYLAAFRKLA